jgi:HPt (histidine-containing phosphotransfer) domain-containing protein
MSERIAIEVLEDLSDLVPGFLARRRGEFEAMRNIGRPRDFAEIARTAHRIRGEGRAYGFDRMSEVGRETEVAAAASDDRAVASLAAGLLDYLDRVEIVYRPAEE